MSTATSLRLGPTQKLTVSATAANSTALWPNHTGLQSIQGVIRIAVSGDCRLRLNPDGAATAATVNDAFFPAGTVEYIDVPAGSVISVIAATGASNSFVTLTEAQGV